MRKDIQIIEIPVYRITRSAFRKETDRLVNSAVGDIDVSEDIRQSIRNNYNYPYLYNEVVGWIRVFVDSIQIRGEYYFIRTKKVRRGFKKDYRFGGKAFEMATFKSQDSNEIYVSVLKKLKTLALERPFTRRVIDLESFQNIGQYLDWRRLIDDNLRK
ncbi:hypothetical protein D3C74_251780 [compost metagenome]